MGVRLGKTKKHIDEVAEMTMEHFGASEICNGFLKEVRRILNRQRGFTSFTFAGEQYVLAFWWGRWVKPPGPTFCVFGTEAQKGIAEEEMKHWLGLAEGQFGRFGFKFQIRFPRDRNSAIKDQASIIGRPDEISP